MKENSYSGQTVKELKFLVGLSKGLALISAVLTISMLVYYFYNITFGKGTSLSIGLPIFTGILGFWCIKNLNTVKAELNKREH